MELPMLGRKIQRPSSGSLGRARLRMSHGIYASAAIAFALALLPTGTSAQSSAKAKPAKVSSSVLQAVHRVAIQVNQNDKAVMELALNNAKNVIEYYASKGETVAVEIVTYGPGLHMLRSDTSPVQDRIKQIADSSFPSSIKFSACNY